MSESNGVVANIKASRNERDIERLADELKDLRSYMTSNHKEVVELIRALHKDQNDKISNIENENAIQKGANRAVLYMVSTAIALIGLAKTLGWI